MNSSWIKSLSLPVISAPMFLVSGPQLVINACKAGIVGSFPTLNARNDTILNNWLEEIKMELNKHSSHPTPFAVNIIVHKTNKRLEENLQTVVRHKVPIVITSLGIRPEVITAIHNYGGMVFHDVTNVVHAEKAVKAGVDGLILVCAGAGGHAGIASPFALLPKIKNMFPNTLAILAGCISDGRSIRAAQTLGADLIYMGTRFIASKESMAQEEYKDMIIHEEVGPYPTYLPTIYTPRISGVPANFLRESIVRAGLDPSDIRGEGLGVEDFSKLDTTSKAWKDIWSAGQGVMNIQDKPSVEDLVQRLKAEYDATIRWERETAKL